MTARVRRYIAFLRAINVGGHTVRMERLRTLFEQIGARSVETFIASGNVIFESGAQGTAALEAKIETHLKTMLGYDVATFLRTPDEVRDVVAHAAFPPGDVASGTLYVAFTSARPTAAAAAAVHRLAAAGDAFHVNGREIYWLRRSTDSPFTGAALERAIGAPATMRNINTVNRLVAKYGS